MQELAVRTWYDKFVLIPGDRLTEKIGEGLAKCRCGLLVLSTAFIRKPWTKYELSGLVNRFVEEKTRLIPIWYGIVRSEVAAFNPALADLFSIKGDPNQIDKCALEVLRAIRPRLYENLKMLSINQHWKSRSKYLTLCFVILSEILGIPLKLWKAVNKSLSNTNITP